MLGDNLDVGFLDDALSLIQNLGSAEHHLASSYAETKDQDYIELLTVVRRDRSEVLSRICPKSEGQLYCMIKHISVAMQNFKELANRFLEEGNLDCAEDYLEKADKYEKIIKVLISEKGKGGNDAIFTNKKESTKSKLRRMQD